MKAVIFRQHGGPEVFEYTDVPDPPLEPGRILVRVKACSVNHLDIWIRQGIPAYRIALPHIVGADVAGIVERVASDITSVQVGERVVLAPGLSCRQCQCCRAGVDNLCTSFGVRGAATDGGYAELVSANAADAILIPQPLSFELAADRKSVV